MLRLPARPTARGRRRRRRLLGRGEELARVRPLCIDLALQVHDRVGLSWHLGLYALALAGEGDTAAAGRIWGAVEAASAFIPGGPWPRDSGRLRGTIEGLANAAFDTAYAQAGDLALEDVAAEFVPA